MIIKTQIMDQLLMEWFKKYLLLPISNDVSREGTTTEDKSIMCVKHLDLFYSQLRTLYGIILHAPLP
jgi:hypothetical protein